MTDTDESVNENHFGQTIPLFETRLCVFPDVRRKVERLDKMIFICDVISVLDKLDQGHLTSV